MPQAICLTHSSHRPSQTQGERLLTLLLRVNSPSQLSTGACEQALPSHLFQTVLLGLGEPRNGPKPRPGLLSATASTAKTKGEPPTAARKAWPLPGGPRSGEGGVPPPRGPCSLRSPLLWQPFGYTPWPARRPELWGHLPSSRKASPLPGAEDAERVTLRKP